HVARPILSRHRRPEPSQHAPGQHGGRLPDPPLTAARSPARRPGVHAARPLGMVGKIDPVYSSGLRPRSRSADVPSREPSPLVPIKDALSRQVDLTPHFRRIVRFVLERPLCTLAWLGVALRIWVYLHGRGYWMDEASLLGNLEGRSPIDFTGPLSSDQLAPPG